jgi:thymidylate synthase
MLNVNDIRKLLIEKLTNQEFVLDKTGVKTIELIGQSFIADEDIIFGEINKDYIRRELNWYLSKSLNINDIEKPVPKIWKEVCDKQGFINSNYGYLIFDEKNFNQFDKCVSHIKANNDTRRATMIYTRPSMHKEYQSNGMSDFICTNAVNYYVRNGQINAVVQMRSNDVIYGYKNDYAWQKYVLDLLCKKTDLIAGDIIWNAGSLHVYERNFNLIKESK